MSTQQHSNSLLVNQESAAGNISYGVHRISREQKKAFLARRIKQILAERTLTPTAFANLLDKKTSEISKWLSGRHNFNMNTLFEIEEKLEITLINIDSPYKPIINGVKAGGITIQAPVHISALGTATASSSAASISNPLTQ